MEKAASTWKRRRHEAEWKPAAAAVAEASAGVDPAAEVDVAVWEEAAAEAEDPLA